ncbi:MAG: hypothetical protein AB9903_17320 [Vulcanimicrobiota bacterium]
MPLWKFRSIEEMNACAQEFKMDNASRQEAIVTLLARFVPAAGKRGVQKFRTIEEANEARLRSEMERSERMKEDKIKREEC